MNSTKCIVGILVLVLTAGIMHAADPEVVAIPTVYCHNEKNNYDGKTIDMITGTGMNGNADDYSGSWPTNLPSLWTATSNGYTAEWQNKGDLLDSGVSINSKIGWAIFDLAQVYTLSDLYIWHGREKLAAVATSYNVYVADTPAVAPTHGPTSSVSIDYDFSSGGTGWTLINTGAPLVGTQKGNQTVDVSGNTGRYIGLEIITGGGVNPGFAEVGITIIPPPSGTVFSIQ